MTFMQSMGVIEGLSSLESIAHSTSSISSDISTSAFNAHMDAKFMEYEVKGVSDNLTSLNRTLDNQFHNLTRKPKSVAFENSSSSIIGAVANLFTDAPRVSYRNKTMSVDIKSYFITLLVIALIITFLIIAYKFK